ncbi:MAG: RNA-binding protein [Thermoplasmata archaeon]|nr:MAG: RNA-binding protein [Thermoplasmata archaeon]
MKLTDRCTSCGKGLIERGFVTFPCPICGNPIGRCENCREQGVEYVCENCGFKGP